MSPGAATLEGVPILTRFIGQRLPNQRPGQVVSRTLLYSLEIIVLICETATTVVVSDDE
jgi:hypothetical protein